MSMRSRLLVLLLALLLATVAAAAEPPTCDVFVGPFPSWANAKADYGPVGDGTADDTAALQTALDDLHQENVQRPVLYLPAGTYRITQTLVLARTKHAEAQHVAILGEDPATTIIRWDGPDDGTMFDYGAWYSRLGRLTFDGRGKAKTALAHGKPFVTYNEIADVVFRDVGFGIEAGARGGAGIAETAVLRCAFVRCTRAGLSIQNFNSLDWWVWHSRFEDCARGVTNTFGAGNFHVYESVFERSTIADASIGNTEYFSLRNNLSIGSQAFFVAGGIGACGMITLQGNTILDARDVPVQVGDHGPVLLLDNVIRTAKAPAVRANPKAGFVSVGNTFTVAEAIDAKLGVRFDDQTVAAETVAVPRPVAPGTPPRFTGPVLEVPAGSKADAIQQALDQAAQQRGQRPVVHLPAGRYAIDHPLVIAAGSDVQLVGDGGRTRLEWTGRAGETAPMLRLPGPVRATLRDFELTGAQRADGLAVANADQPGARLFMEQANVTGAKQVGFLVDGLGHADVSLHDFEHAGCQVGVKVIGPGQPEAGATGSLLPVRGATAAADAGTGGKPPVAPGSAGRVVIFSGASSDHELAYDLERGGSLLARDIWYETGQFPHFLHLRDAGSFTLHGSKVAVPQKGGEPAVRFDGFRGQASFLTTVFIGSDMKPAPVLVQGDGAQTRVLLLGTLVGRGDDYLVNQAAGARIALRESFRYTPGGGSEPIADQGAADPDFVRAMLAATRRERPRALAPLPPGVTDLRVYRVLVSNCQTCIRLAP